MTNRTISHRPHGHNRKKENMTDIQEKRMTAEEGCGKRAIGDGDSRTDPH